MSNSETASNNSVGAVAKALLEANRVLVCTHRNPDGDGLGSAIAAILGLESLGKKAAGLCPGTMLAHFYDIPHARRLNSEIPKGIDFDTTLILDCAELERVDDGFNPAGRIINIDHHGSNPMFGDLNWVDPKAAAVGEMVDLLLEKMGAEISPDIAQALYMAIMTDTGSFRYANTRPETFEIASRLLAQGADPAAAARLYWENVTVESVRLRGEALSAMQLAAGGKVAWSRLTAEQYAANGGMINEPEGLSGALRGIRGVEVGALFTETPDKSVRISLRSHGKVDVSKIAAQFGGGGHPSAAGATIKDTLENARANVLAALEKVVR
jgi:phosphoesterase RecJ-like protein